MKHQNKQEFPNKSFFAIEISNLHIINYPKKFGEIIFDLIKKSTTRIYISSLYLADDAAGEKVLELLYKKKNELPSIDIKIFVDFHRAQRGRIGEEENFGFLPFYQQLKNKYSVEVPIYGVPIKKMEALGILHLKGFIFDNTLIYSGASINNVYLHYLNHYRLDRYYQIEDKALADSFIQYLQNFFLSKDAVTLFDKDTKTYSKDIKKEIFQLRKSLKKSFYIVPEINTSIKSDQIGITPLVGLGSKGNLLNQTILKAIKSSKEKVRILTPYFNFPSPVKKQIKKLLKKGVSVEITIGDKTANDFYIPPTEEFHKIGILPYLYEQNLRTFLLKNKEYVANGNLKVYLWQDKGNSYHLKGIDIDNKYRFITGNNLNPRAWNLDLENGLFIQDPHKLMSQDTDHEFKIFKNNSILITSPNEIDQVKDYPLPVQKLFNRLKRTKLDALAKRFL